MLTWSWKWWTTNFTSVVDSILLFSEFMHHHLYLYSSQKLWNFVVAWSYLCCHLSTTYLSLALIMMSLQSLFISLFNNVLLVKFRPLWDDQHREMIDQTQSCKVLGFFLTSLHVFVYISSFSSIKLTYLHLCHQFWVSPFQKTPHSH